jgi:hypothetical protein
MATEQKTGDQGTQQEAQMRGEIGSPVSNDAYNIVAALHEKLQGLEAMRKFAKDGDLQIWKQLTQLDVQAVDKLVDQLEQLFRDGKFRGVKQQAQRPTARS